MELTPLAGLILKRGGTLRAPADRTFLDYSIPADYEQFLMQHDGSDGMDEAGWRFWGRSELRRITEAPEITVGHPLPPGCEEPGNYILFADHLICAGFLCFRVQRPRSDTPLFYFFGLGALLPLALDWHDLHYAIEHESDSAPIFDALHQRCLAAQCLRPPLLPGEL